MQQFLFVAAAVVVVEPLSPLSLLLWQIVENLEAFQGRRMDLKQHHSIGCVFWREPA